MINSKYARVAYSGKDCYPYYIFNYGLAVYAYMIGKETNHKVEFPEVKIFTETTIIKNTLYHYFIKWG